MADLATNATIAFQIGNVELTNLIVQDQVTKIQTEITRLQSQMSDRQLLLEKKESELCTRVHDLGTKQWGEKIKQLALLLCEFGFTSLDRAEGQSSSEAYDAYSLTFRFNEEATTLTRRWAKGNNSWTQEEIDILPEDIYVGFYHTKSWKGKDGQTWSSSIHLPLSERATYERLPILLDEETKECLRSCRKLHVEITAFNKEKSALEEKIADTGLIEKKVLAALTQRTLALNPELMDQIGNIVGAVEGGLPLLEARNG